MDTPLISLYQFGTYPGVQDLVETGDLPPQKILEGKDKKSMDFHNTSTASGVSSPGTGSLCSYTLSGSKLRRLKLKYVHVCSHGAVYIYIYMQMIAHVSGKDPPCLSFCLLSLRQSALSTGQFPHKGPSRLEETMSRPKSCRYLRSMGSSLDSCHGVMDEWSSGFM